MRWMWYSFLGSSSKLYRIVVDSMTPYSLQIFSREDILLEEESKFSQSSVLPAFKDIEDTHAALAQNAWTVLFK